MASAIKKEIAEDSDQTFNDELKPGTSLMHGQYTIERFLNAGGFGITYLARDSLDRKIVIKECFPGTFCRRSDTIVHARSRAHQAELKSIVRLFVQEARSLAKLDHPNIVGVHQVFEDNDTAYMALDFIEGRDLLDTLEDESEKLPPKEVEQMLIQILDAVEFIHENAMLHRDISPDNILLDAERKPVLIDFGAAREQATKASRVLSAMRVVKDGYSPQEFYIAGSDQSPSSDLYALGATFYHVIAGETPPNSQARLAAVASGEEDPYVSLSKHEKATGYEKYFLDAIDKALRVLPKDRLQSAGEWKDLIVEEKRVEAALKAAQGDTEINSKIASLVSSASVEEEPEAERDGKTAAAATGIRPRRVKSRVKTRVDAAAAARRTQSKLVGKDKSAAGAQTRLADQAKVASGAKPQKSKTGLLLASAAVMALIAGGVVVTQTDILGSTEVSDQTQTTGTAAPGSSPEDSAAVSTEPDQAVVAAEPEDNLADPAPAASTDTAEASPAPNDDTDATASVVAEPTTETDTATADSAAADQTAEQVTEAPGTETPVTETPAPADTAQVSPQARPDMVATPADVVAAPALDPIVDGDTATVSAGQDGAEAVTGQTVAVTTGAAEAEALQPSDPEGQSGTETASNVSPATPNAAAQASADAVTATGADAVSATGAGADAVSAAGADAAAVAAAENDATAAVQAETAIAALVDSTTQAADAGAAETAPSLSISETVATIGSQETLGSTGEAGVLGATGTANAAAVTETSDVAVGREVVASTIGNGSTQAGDAGASGDILEASFVLSGWSVELPFASEASAPVTIATVTEQALPWMQPGTEIVTVNGTAIASFDEISTVLRENVTLSDEPTLAVEFEAIAPGDDQVVTQTAELPVVQNTALLNGTRFRTVFEEGTWTTSVASVPGEVDTDLQAGDIVMAYMPTSERFTERDSVKTFFNRELENGQNSFSFAVLRDGSIWVATFRNANNGTDASGTNN